MSGAPAGTAVTAVPAVDDEIDPGAGLVAQRLTAQLLAGPPARDPLTVAERLLSIQAQDPRGARLAIRARSVGVRAADVDRELTERRTMLITWLNRGTLHLVRSEDYPWLHALMTPPLQTTSATRLAQMGIGPAQADRAVAVIERALVDEGPLTRLALRERLQRADVPTEGQAFVHLLYRASLRGILVRGPMDGREHAYALARDWLPPAPPFHRGRALGELARRYLAGHGPATDRDLARWAGLPLRDARAGLATIAAQLRQCPGSRVDLSDRRPPAPLPPPRLLGAFEPLLLGWCSREEVLGDAAATVVGGGIFRAFALAGERAVAGWRLTSSGSVQIEPFGELAPTVLAALGEDALDVTRFLVPDEIRNGRTGPTA